MIIKVTLSHENTQAEFDLAGTPNGTCTSGFGCKWLHKKGLEHYFLLNESSLSMQRSIQNNFQDIRSLGNHGDIINIEVLDISPDMPTYTLRMRSSGFQ